jgi:hypothetical protein
MVKSSTPKPRARKGAKAKLPPDAFGMTIQLGNRDDLEIDLENLMSEDPDQPGSASCGAEDCLDHENMSSSFETLDSANACTQSLSKGERGSNLHTH